MTSFANPAALLGSSGELGASDWFTIDQKRIDGFAEITEDRQWIHVDTERAKSGPFGTTIAHGYLTLSLVPVFLTAVVHIGEVQAGINYGLNKVRFPATVPVDSRVRGVVSLVSAAQRGPSVEAVFGITIEIDGGSRPACVAEAVVLYT